MCVSNRLLRIRATNDANQLVIDTGVFGDAVMIGRLADLVERTRFPNAPDLWRLIGEELRARAAIVASMRRG